MLEKVKKFVDESFRNKGKNHQMDHFLNTIDWLLEIKPDADEAMQIAAVAHDIERAFRKSDVNDRKMEYGFTDSKFLEMHSERGAEIIGKFLEKNDANKEIIAKVKKLVSTHEVGGDEDQNFIKDADSLSFFEVNVKFFLTEKVKVNGKERVKEKFDWMYNRISSKKAKKLAKPMYENALKCLETI
jgi:hypothetical protein